MKHRIFQKVLPIIHTYQNYQIHAIGNSYGCALAFFTSMELIQEYGTSPSAISLTFFGPPRFVNKYLAHKIDKQLNFNKVIRVIHSSDIVPRLFQMKRGFRHFGVEYWMDNKNRHMHICDDVDSSGESPSCINSLPFSKLTVRAHNSYFSRHQKSACAPMRTAEVFQETFLPFDIIQKRI